MTTEKIAYTVKEHTKDEVAERSGPGWFYNFETSPDVRTGPFSTEDAAHQHALEAVSKAVVEATFAALFGEAA
jgi:hypothetical protein